MIRQYLRFVWGFISFELFVLNSHMCLIISRPANGQQQVAFDFTRR